MYLHINYNNYDNERIKKKVLKNYVSDMIMKKKLFYL